jgi:hypothetical protein
MIFKEFEEIRWLRVCKLSNFNINNLKYSVLKIYVMLQFIHNCE